MSQPVLDIALSSGKGMSHCITCSALIDTTCRVSFG